MSYGLPKGTRITYGAAGFPGWVYQLGKAFGLKASTYPGHQESNRSEAGYAPNPQNLNRGIDWSGSVADMQRFAEYCLSVRDHLEQVIWENPQTGRRIGVAGGKDVSSTGYYASDYSGHRDHVHTRQSKPIPLPDNTNGGQPVGYTGDPVWLEQVLRAELGDRLVVHAGWEKRGTGNGVNGTNQMGDIWGVMIHHTGNRNATPESIINGRPDLKGPLSQCLITPDGKCHLVAIGPCNHAGSGYYPGLGSAGNQRSIGFECAWPTIRPDGSYDKNERWPDAQIITMRDATAAVLRRLGYDASHVCGHKEYNKVDGKWDPGNLDMNWFRGEVQKDLDGYQFPGEKPAPAPAPAPSPTLLPEDHVAINYYANCAYWEMLGWRTQTEALALILDKLLGTENAGKTGVTLRRPEPPKT